MANIREEEWSSITYILQEAIYEQIRVATFAFNK